MICSYCKSDIDNDSFYCDQCGKELFICPTCGKPGKGKNCVEDGSKLISPKQKSATTLSDNNENQAPSVAPPASIFNQSFPSSPNTQQPVFNYNSAVPLLRMINNKLKIDVKLEDGDIIGRTTGNYISIFSQFPHISSQHAQFIFDKNNGWSFMDLGSTNGSKISNSTNWQNVPQLKPQKLETLSNNCFVLLANIEFQIKISLQLTTTTGTQRL